MLHRLFSTIVYFLRRLMLCLPILCCGIAGKVIAATEVGGGITADVVWRVADSPYVVGETITIANGATLSIEAGAVIYMSPATQIIVQAGGLRVNGTSVAPVRITSRKIQSGWPAAPGDWGKLIFSAGTIGAKTRLDNVLIEYGQGLTLTGASPTLNNVAVNHHDGPAITADLNASPQGGGNSATGNTINGIVVPAGVLTGTTTWALRGIPYVLEEGRLSIGIEPSLTAFSPATVEQGERASATLTGTRLIGLEKLRFDPAISEASVQPGATDISANVLLNVPVDMPTGPVRLTAQTDAGEVALANALSITPMQPPSIGSVTPKTVARKAETTVLLNGSSLSTATVTASTPGMTISGLSAAHSSLSFRVAVDADLAPAIYPLQAVNAAGQAPFTLEVIPDVIPRPPFEIIPPLVALTVDGTFRSVIFRASQTSAQERRYTAAIDDPTVASIRSASLILPSGQFETSLALKGLKNGSAVLRITGDGLTSPLEAPVSVSGSAYVQAMLSPAVGLVRGEAFTGNGGNRSLISTAVGILIGNGNTTNSADVKALSPVVGVNKGNLFGTPSMVVSPAVGINKQR